MLQEAPTKHIPSWVSKHAIDAFTLLAHAEAHTHGAAGPDHVHFHEVGAVDSIVDTVGTLIALHALGVTTVTCSRLPLGEGTVWTDHGLLPVPAPATLRLLVDMPTCPGPPGVTGELVTPTAAALLKTLVKSCGPPNVKVEGRPPAFTIRSIGIGAGTKDFVKHPNILRLVLGDTSVSEDRKTENS
ncbi:Pyridinium-3,5-bisthiocarboxylic acid mononucleotide nickel insertion protein [Seminavis robusta]|uniref:Pyridinium-3,5-bisthiocarboxylic acid mononucleotide nickel insertion protein n=1 Tax=Seminavis robusta TaxID=568900 RepID=A0A9N8GZW0_9STRA|nr:Pyridinium-3,5-bisthiocarboxylic acid mononucleotide nickel insertion protein [Seminavis robusta]|eukprot:Sro9_g007740.1 Pyridinium-3,5-bisthiocarboxylic acid mononucleotide nickel insertion protein (186) ;mRNA; r:233508-234065